jgi:uncharacterized protein YkwD
MRRNHRIPAGPTAPLANASHPLRHRLSLTVLLTALIASLTFSASPAHAATCTGANLLPAIASIPTAKAATLCLINAERSANGLAPLISEPTLDAVATTYSQSMVTKRFFGHVSPAGETIRERLAAYASSASVWSTGENLAWGEGALATPAAIVKNWMASPGHRANILNADFTETGVGIVGGSPAGSLPAVAATYTTEFGARETAAAGPAATRASASSAAPQPVSSSQAKRVTAKKKQSISKRCHRIAKRTKGSKKSRAKRYDRCVDKALRAAAR